MAELSERELEILRYVATGASNKEIAKTLSISTNTVKVHLRNIFSKIGVVSRTEAAMYAVKNGMIFEKGRDNNDPDNRISTNSIGSPPTRRIRTSLSTVPFLVWIILPVLFLGIVLVIINNIRGPNTSPVVDSSIFNSSPRWTQLIPMSMERAAFALVYLDNQLFAIGGETANGVSPESEKFSLETGSWDKILRKPTPVRHIKAVSVNGLVYVPGGETINGTISDAMEIYNPEIDTWLTSTKLPQPRSGYSLIVHEGKIYLLGGWDGEEYTNTVFRFDPDAEQWDVLAPMKIPRAYAGAAVADGLLYTLGGRNLDGDLDNIEVYTFPNSSLPEGAWEDAGSLPDPRSSMAVYSIADSIFLIGGVSDGSVNSLENLAYNPQEGTWLSFDSPIQGDWSNPGIAGTGTHLYILGGSHTGLPISDAFSFQVIYSVLLPIVK